MLVSSTHREAWRRSWALEAEALEVRRRQFQAVAPLAAAELHQRWPGVGVWLFGSVLGEGFRPGSDLDLAVEALAASEQLTALAQLEQQLDAEVRRLGIAPIPIDLVRIESLPLPWQQRIRLHGQRLE
jgi:predicted nucleotidyltransferase